LRFRPWHRPNEVTDWTSIALNTVAAEPPISSAPNATAVFMAMTQGAVYGAVNAIDRHGRPYLVQRSFPKASLDAAVATAAYRVLDSTGGCPKDAESLLAGACPVVGSYGAKDRTQRGAAQRLERALTANGIEHDVKEYPDAGHSFLNDHRDLMFRMLRVAGIGYHEPSAQDARHRIVSFFDTHLKS
jgi:acetyl esterase/lipase